MLLGGEGQYLVDVDLEIIKDPGGKFVLGRFRKPALQQQQKT